MTTKKMKKLLLFVTLCIFLIGIASAAGLESDDTNQTAMIPEENDDIVTPTNDNTIDDDNDNNIPEDYTEPVENVMNNEDNDDTNTEENSTNDNITESEVTPKRLIETRITLDNIPDLDVPETVSISGLFMDEFNRTLGGCHLKLDVNGVEYTVITDSSGVFRRDYNPKYSGIKNVSVSYPGNKRYSGASAQTTFNISKDIALVSVHNIKRVEYSKNTTVSGRVTNIAFKPLEDMDVELIFNNKTSVTVTTNEDGRYTYNYTTTRTGENTVTIRVIESNEYQEKTRNATFNVSKRQPIIIISPIPVVEYTKNTTITATLTNRENIPLRNIEVEITVNNKSDTVKTDSKGQLTYNHTTDFIGKNNLTIAYHGNTKYNALNKTTTFKVTKRKLLMSVNDIEDVPYAANVRVAGRITNIDQIPLQNLGIEITINDNNTITTKTNANGEYSYTYSAYELGQNTITIDYNGKTRYQPTGNSTKFNVIQRSTNLTLDPIDDCYTKVNAKIHGKLMDNYGNPLNNTELTLTINENRYDIKTIENGEYTYIYDTTVEGQNNVTISFTKSPYYSSSSINTTFNVSRRSTRMILNDVPIAQYSKKITISGRYEDSFSNDLTYTPVTIVFNNKTYTTKTDGHGNFTYNLTVNSIGTNNLSLSYHGNIRYSGATNATTFLSIKINDDTGKEVVLTKSIATVNGKPDISKLGLDYRYADDNGVYTIRGDEIVRVKRLDSYCQEIYGFVPKYTFFRTIDSDFKYVISREKWNVIARALNSYHVKQGFSSVPTPYAITVNLTGKIRYYPIYYDRQEVINGHSWTCGPTSMSMISQALNIYHSERYLADFYSTTSKYGTSEDKIVARSPNVHMKVTNIADTKSSVKNALLSGKVVLWHIRGHYMCVLGYNSQTDRFLCMNPSGPRHNIEKVQWATWGQMMNTDKGLKERGFMAVSPTWNLNSTMKTYVRNYYNNMGGKYSTPNNNEYSNNGDDNKVKVTVTKP